ncbi:MAG: chorismate synthase [bacterium]
MYGCNLGTLFKLTVGGGSYQEGMTVHIQGVPPGMQFTEEQIYREMLLRKPGQGELSSPRKEPDIPILYSGFNVDNTMVGFENARKTNGTPLVILIPNLDRHFEHIEQYRVTNRTPRPGHASYATYQKYGECDDSIGAGIFSGRYTNTIVAAGAVAKEILKKHGIFVYAYVRELAGVVARDMPFEEIRRVAEAYRKVRVEHDVIYQAFFASGLLKPEMRLLEKMAVLVDFEKIRDAAKVKKMVPEKIKAEYGVHYSLNCPDVEAAEQMHKRTIEIRDEGDSAGGLVEIIATGIPAGMGEPVFRKLDAEIGRMLGIASVKAVEIGAGIKAKDMKGSKCNDQMRMKEGRVVFDSNNAGGITGGITTGQDIIARITVKPTPTIGKDQHTIDKVSLEDKVLSAVTRRDPTIVARVWPVAEAYMAIILLDYYIQHIAYQKMREK